LAQGLDQEGVPRIKVKKEAPLTWSLSSGDAWPVFVRRHVLGRPLRAAWLKAIALAGKRYSSNRVSVSPQGDLDLFFNDRASLAKASNDLKDLGRDLKGVPASLSSCRGLLFCPLAAIDTFGAGERLVAALKAKNFRPGQPLARVSIHGCGAGGALDCGVESFSDFRLIGARDRPPLVNQELLALSPHLDRLVSGCPGGALTPSKMPGMALDHCAASCTRCGLCLATDPSFYWPEPQGGYLRLELSGRRKFLGPGAYVQPVELIPRVKENMDSALERLAGLIALWQKERLPDEIVADYMARAGIMDFFKGV
jgi:dissimilatory sulfite reductase (desulfoviridin) alpha/beta subunit